MEGREKILGRFVGFWGIPGRENETLEGPRKAWGSPRGIFWGNLGVPG